MRFVTFHRAGSGLPVTVRADKVSSMLPLKISELDLLRIETGTITFSFAPDQWMKYASPKLIDCVKIVFEDKAIAWPMYVRESMSECQAILDSVDPMTEIRQRLERIGRLVMKFTCGSSTGNISEEFARRYLTEGEK